MVTLISIFTSGHPISVSNSGHPNISVYGMLLLIDFEKAFDSLSWNFIEKALDLFNFKISIKNWIRTLYYNSTSRVLQN